MYLSSLAAVLQLPETKACWQSRSGEGYGAALNARGPVACSRSTLTLQPTQPVQSLRIAASGRAQLHRRRGSTVASPINLLTNNDSELTGTRLQRPMLTDWSSPLAISEE